MRPGEKSTPYSEQPDSPGEFQLPEVYQDNKIVNSLPAHLTKFIVDQYYDSYQPIDHAVWRYVMRQNLNFLRDHAHEAYINGLDQTGISVEVIPSIRSINEILGRIGWAAVTVDGFIPPAAFMEFQAHRILVIAADIRQLEHIEYTPAPDIIHEAAGHAPIIADPEYAEYLRQIGEVGAKAMSTREDYELYEAIRHLSILKEQPDAEAAEVAQAESNVADKQNNLGEPSEMARLSRLHWWTVEYGLVGPITDPKIYGAGLLSSIGESTNCLSEKVGKLPFDLGAAEYAFDITTEQPQLFCTPDFGHLMEVLEQFASSMAFRRGGQAGLEKAIACANLCTYVYSSGLQVSGVVSESRIIADNQPCLVQTSGASMLSVNDRMLAGHGRATYPKGFISPVGRLAGSEKALENFTDEELRASGIIEGQPCQLHFVSEITVTGRLEKVVRYEGRIILLRFSAVVIKRDGQTIYQSGNSPFFMGVGEKILSVFGGAADQDAYEISSLVPVERTIRASMNEAERRLQKLYQEVRNLREKKQADQQLRAIWKRVKQKHQAEWLLPLEILELLSENRYDPELSSELRGYLEQTAIDRPNLLKLIERGLALVN